MAGDDAEEVELGEVDEHRVGGQLRRAEPQPAGLLRQERFAFAIQGEVELRLDRQSRSEEPRWGDRLAPGSQLVGVVQQRLPRADRQVVPEVAFESGTREFSKFDGDHHTEKTRGEHKSFSQTAVFPPIFSLSPKWLIP